MVPNQQRHLEHAVGWDAKSDRVVLLRRTESDHWRLERELPPAGIHGHVSNTWFNGYDIGLEGQRLNGVETADRFFIYRFVDDQTILSVSQPYEQTLVLGQIDKPMDFWVSGMVDVPRNYVRTQGLVLYPLSLPPCNASNAGRFNYASGAPGVKDTVTVCAKDSNNVYAWRTIY
jgi:hypothetical protein